MLSYQHLYHAGNLADVHKHALLAVALAHMAAKDKPLTYIETHAGRALYDLSAPEAVKTGEAAAGIGRAADWFPPDHPYGRALAVVRQAHGPSAYPGSPMVAAALLRPDDVMHLAELHPQEHASLAAVLGGRARVHAADGFALARSLCPPTPRRGLLLVDPSWEVKADYASVPRFLAETHRKWNVGVLMLWYPLLPAAPHLPMLAALERAHPGALRHEVTFPQLRPGRGLAGSGLFVINPPWPLAEEAARLTALFAAL